MKAVFACSPLVLRPELAFEGLPRFLVIDLPPSAVASVENVCEGCSFVTVVDCDKAPGLCASELTILCGETWTGGEDTDSFAPPASVVSDAGGIVRTVLRGFRISTHPADSSCSASPIGNFRRCLRVTLPILESAKCCSATTSMSSMISSRVLKKAHGL